MCFGGFHPFGGDGPQGFIQIKLGPRTFAKFGAAGTGEEKSLDIFPIRIG